ncbi:MAG: hypothetical protein VX353_08120 [Actinomycetota bacterium]
MKEFERFQRKFSSGDFSDEGYWKAWRKVWDSCHQFTDYFNGDLEERDNALGAIFSRHINFRSSFMTEYEEKKLLSLPNHINVFRGGQQANISGWSWTLDRLTAEQYAFTGATDNRPLLAIASGLSSSAILAYIETDGVAEVIIDPFTITIETAEFAKITFERLFKQVVD